MMHLKMMLVRGSSERTRCGNWRLQRGSPLNPDGTESQVWIDPPPEAELGPEYIWEAVSAFPGLKERQGLGTVTARKFSRIPCR